VHAALSRAKTVRVPYNFSFTPPARDLLERHFGTPALEDLLSFPVASTSLKSIKPKFGTPQTAGQIVRDEFGVGWAQSALDRGSPVAPPLAEASLAGYRFPDPAAAYRFEDLSAWCRAQREQFTLIWVGDLWERATFLRGMEQMLLDLALDAEFVETLLREITDYILRTLEILLARFEFDAIALSDDYGTQRAMMMSPAHWRRYLRPRVAEIYALAHKHGRIVFHHSCGHIEPIIGDLIDIGLDVLHPIQPEAMDVYRLKRQFGRRLSFWGGIRTQTLLPSGTPAQVRDEVRHLKQIMGEGGGYVLEPGITLQADVPLANLLAMIEEARAD
jgi:uroporphyrinogen decarboxylase